MIDGLTGKQLDWRAAVPEGWEGQCVLCRRKVTWREVRGELAGVLTDGPHRACVCRRHLDTGTKEQVARIGQLLAIEIERLKKSVRLKLRP